MAEKKKTIKDLETEIKEKDTQINSLLRMVEMHQANEKVLKEIIVMLNKNMLGL